MAGLGDYAAALQMRDIMQRTVVAEVDRARPRYRYGTVVSIDTANSKCTVQFPGDASTTPVSMGVVIQPTTVGQIVRVDGLLGDRFVSDVITPEVVPSLEPWITPTLGANWSAYGAGFPGPGYYKDPEGWVHLRGLVKRTDATNGIGQIIFTLPVGYRPWVATNQAIMCNDASAYLAVNTSGTVVYNGPTGNASGYLSLDCISFPAYGSRFEDVYDVERPQQPSWINASGLSIPTGDFSAFCKPRFDGLIRGMGGSVGFTASGTQGYIPDILSGRWTELHSVFGYNVSSGGYNAGRLDVEGSNGRISMYDFTFGAQSQIDITGRHFWCGTEQGWTFGSYLNGWGAWNGTFPPFRYRKDVYGVVHVSGLITGGTATGGTPMVTLPVGYRPQQRLVIHTLSNVNPARVDVLTDGSIIANPGVISSYTSLEDIYFRTDS